MPIPPLRPRSQATLSSPRPRNKKSQRDSNKKRWWRYLVLAAVVCFLVAGIGLIGAFAYYSKDLPDPEKINDRSVAESTRIYARDETTLLYEIHGDVRRTIVPLDDIPAYVVNATIAIEDKNFWTHKGISITGIIRSALKNVVSGDISGSGGSTITQQFIKNAVLTNEKRYSRKIKEAVLAYQMESKFSKEQILQFYFNEIPYGSNVYGIEAASQYYFNTDVQNLSIAQGSLLAALPQAPTLYSPHGNNTDLLVGRQQYVIELMLKRGYITEQQAKEAKAVDVLSQVAPPRESIVAPHFVFYVKEYLTEKYGEAIVERGGLKVITTLEPTLQEYAEEAVREYGEMNESRYGATNESLVSLNPITGQILAMVGSRDYFNAEIDGSVNVALRTRNPGSSFKPIVYGTAFAKGYTPDTVLFDLETNFGPQGDGSSYIPKNYDGGTRGPVTMRKALQGSLNIPAVKTLYLAGIPDVVEQAKKMNYTTVGDADQYGLALALGGAGVRLLDHTAAFGVFAQEGMWRKPQAVLKVLDHKGKILEQFSVSEKEVMDQNIARMVANILSDNDSRAYVFGSSSYLQIPGRQVAAKTGTTNDNRDAWTIGFTPSLVTGVWGGNNDNSEMSRSAGGSTVAAPIWNSFMKKALAGAPQERFPTYNKPATDKPILNGDLEGESTIYVDSVTKKAIPQSCLVDYPAAFKETSSYREVHTILYYVDKMNPTVDPPSDPTTDPQYARWEEPVQAWAKEQGYTNTKPSEGGCTIRAKDVLTDLSFVSPEKGDTVASFAPTVTVDVTAEFDITSLSIYIGDALVGSTKNGLMTKIDLSDFPNGFQTLTATITDQYKNTLSKNVEVNLLVPGNTNTTQPN